MRRYEFVITGGPCAGKTTCLSVLEQRLTERGYKVIVVAETATEVISSGLTPFDLPAKVFQSAVLDMSVKKEEVVRRTSSYFEKDVVILYDRGILDGKAYVSLDVFEDILESRNLSEIQVRDRYDAVFHLVSAADGAEEFYTLANNKARSETVEQARAIDLKTRNAWVGHPHFRVIDNSSSFDDKVNRLCAEVLATMGLPVPIEIERKYLIKMPHQEDLVDVDAVKQSILQTYLTSEDPLVERRVRQRGNGTDFSYYYTEKKNLSDLGRLETERRISEKEYLSLLLEAEKFVRKDRYCFVYKSQYFELDLYPKWKNEAILEIELTTETTEPELPEWIEVVREVTTEAAYKNYNLAEEKK